MTNTSKKAAYFLLHDVLHNSPPNDAIRRCLAEAGVECTYFSPEADTHDKQINKVEYGFRWLVKHLFDRRWRDYDVFVATSEDPVAIAGLLAFIYRKPLIFLADEIRSGSYYGTRKESWKKLCRWAMRRAKLVIVNDSSRVDLQRQYANHASSTPIAVYPGCFYEPPLAINNTQQRQQWNVADGQLVLGFSGSVSINNGFDLALQSLDHFQKINLVTQPLGLDALSNLLLNNLKHHLRISIAPERMTWQQSWASMGGVDIGVAIYQNQAPQFQHMGISSNRLCMFLAMGVPVIVSRQPSFEFIEEYDCGVMISDANEFNAAIEKISTNLQSMKENALRCAREYIDTASKLTLLENEIVSAIGSE